MHEMLGFFEGHSPASWSQTDRDSTFTNSGLTCTGGGGGTGNYVSAMCGQKLAANQKIYFEIIVVSLNNGGIGVGNPNESIGNYLGADTNGINLYFPSGWAYNGSVASTLLTVPNAGDIVSFAIDGIDSLIWARINGGNWNGDVIANQNPATVTGGFSCVGIFGAKYMLIGMSSNNTSESYTLIPGASAFSYTPPLGFRSPNSVATK
jgi:hypothetical protein